MFSNSFNIKEISRYAQEFITEGNQDAIIINNKKTWCNFSYKANNKTEKVFTAAQLYAISRTKNKSSQQVFTSILINYCHAKPLDAYYIAGSGALNLVSFEGISETEKKRLLLGFDVKLKKGASFFSDEGFYELVQTSMAMDNDGQIVRALQACAFEYLKHRRFTPTSAASKFMIDTYFPELSNVREPLEKDVMDVLTVSPETTLTEVFLQKMAHSLAYRILTSNTKALNNIRQLSAGSKPYKICHKIDFNNLMILMKSKFSLKNLKNKKKYRDMYKEHLRLYGISNEDFLYITSVIIEIKSMFNKDECYAAFCLTGDSNLKGTYPNNFLNIMRRVWFMYFSLEVKLAGRQLKSAIKEALEDVEIRSYWERKKGKPICNYEVLKAGAPDIRLDINVIKKIDKIPILEFLRKYYSS